MAIAGTIVTRALRLARVIASGETPQAAQMQDGLEALNAMLADWSAGEALTEFQLVQRNFPCVTTTTSFTIGPTGNLVQARPYAVSDLFARIGGIDYPIEPMTASGYMDIGIKNLSSGFPQFAHYSPDLPNGTLYLWPAALPGHTIFFNSREALGESLVETTNIAVPKNYDRGLAYCLAAEIAPEYGKEVLATVARIAMIAKRSIKLANTEVPVLQSDAAGIGSDTNRSWNILANR